MSEQSGPVHRPATCATCAEELNDFVEGVLTGELLPEDSDLLDHLEACARCAETYGGLVQMVTAPHVERLRTGPGNGAADPVPLGLLDLWRVHLGLRHHFGDAQASAIALSVIGMIHRQAGRLEDARDAHRLALKTCPKNLITRLMSKTDLGHIALNEGHPLKAAGWLFGAATAAVRVGDRDAYARIVASLRRAADIVHRDALAASLDAFNAGWVKPAFQLAGAGERILVADAGREIPMKVKAGPEIDRDGVVHVAIGMDPAALGSLKGTFRLDLLFVPTGEALVSQSIGPVERKKLESVEGLDLNAPLPRFEQVLESLRTALHQTPKNRLKLPRRAIEIRLWLRP